MTLFSTLPYGGQLYESQFNLLKPILFDERLFHLTALEIAILEHPTSFHSAHLQGTSTVSFYKTYILV